MEKIIAIDGPAGAGKSTVSKLLANKLGFSYLDTGAMYRVITYLALKRDIDLNDIDKIVKLCEDINIDFLPPGEDGISHIHVNGIDVTDKIRRPEIDKNVSLVAKIKPVREIMVNMQREIAKNGNIIMDGRDIGSCVLPNADLKFFVTASLTERAKRRWQELQEKNIKVSLDDVKRKISNRDKLDSERKVSPLVKTSDAILIDTTNLSIDAVLNKMINIIKDESNE